MSASVIFLLIAGAAGVGLVRTIRAQARDRRYLDARGEDPLEVSHLSRALRAFAHETRALRLSLDGPLRDLESVVGPREDVDMKLSRASRELGDWLRMAERLGADDRAYLVDLGIDTGRVAAIFEECGFSFDRVTAGSRRVADRIRAIARELGHMEEVLQRQHDPYR